MTALYSSAYWRDKLELIAHPEGGYYRQTYRSDQQVTRSNTPKTFRAGTSIYYLLGSFSVGQFSAWHRLHDTEETWYYHFGAEVMLYWFDAQDQLQRCLLGVSPAAEMQVHLPANCWFAAQVNDLASDAYALVGCSCFPGFDFSNFELAVRQELEQAYPQHRQIIQQFTRI